jgi:hypothetical protein
MISFGEVVKASTCGQAAFGGKLHKPFGLFGRITHKPTAFIDGNITGQAVVERMTLLH